MSHVRDLERQLEAAYAAIQEVDDDFAAGRLGATDHAELKARSERRAATLLERVRAARQSPPAPAPRPAATPRPAPAPRLRPLALTACAVGLLGFGVALGVLVARFTSDEPAAPAAAAAPAGMAVAPAGMAAPPAAGGSAALQALGRELERDDAPTDALLRFAHQALDEGQLRPAIAAYKRVLARDARNVEAIAHIGLILYQGGHVDQALARIDQALALDPKYAHALWDKGRILTEARQDYGGAAKALEAFLVLVPSGNDADRARIMLADARQRRAPAAPVTR